VGEQVLLISPDGEAGKGVAIRGIYYKGRKEPGDSKDKTVIIEFQDGSRIAFDEEKGFSMDIKQDIKINCDKKVNITAKEAVIDSKTTIKLGENAIFQDGVVTGACTCAFTGTPHADKSSTVLGVR
jgi:phage baseplate assembly protein V